MYSKTRILWIERNRAVNSDLLPGLRGKGFQIEAASNGRDAIKKLSENTPHVVVVNAASLRTNGRRICLSLNENSHGIPILLITDRELSELANVAANVILKLPFTSRKLLNRIIPLLPGEDKHLRQAGPIRLDIEKGRVYCQGRAENLTPRMQRLLLIFMDRSNEIVEREDLFREAWETGYTGDTRTLDVHISWLRKAIEKDPRNPVLLITIRGVGYRLDV